MYRSLNPSKKRRLVFPFPKFSFDLRFLRFPILGYDAETLTDRSTVVAHWSIKTLGHCILDLQVDEITVTEVTRLLTLSSGAHVKQEISSYRNSYRGG